jgi:hypothetical protein
MYVVCVCVFHIAFNNMRKAVVKNDYSITKSHQEYWGRWGSYNNLKKPQLQTVMNTINLQLLTNRFKSNQAGSRSESGWFHLPLCPWSSPSVFSVVHQLFHVSPPMCSYRLGCRRLTYMLAHKCFTTRFGSHLLGSYHDSDVFYYFSFENLILTSPK